MSDKKSSSFKLRSGNRTAFKQMGSSDGESSPMQSHIGPHGYHKNNPHGSSGPNTNSRTSRKRWENANLDDNPAVHRNTMFQGDYLGEAGWSQDGWGKHNYRQHPSYIEMFDKNGDGKISKKENRKASKSGKWQTWQGFKGDIKKDNTIPLLTQEQANKGQYLVQDPYGKYHRMSKNGTPLGGRGSYDKRSWEWRQGNVWDPNAGEGGKGGYVPYTGQGFGHDTDATQSSVNSRHLSQGGGVPEGGELNEFTPAMEPISLEPRTIDRIPTGDDPQLIRPENQMEPQVDEDIDVDTDEGGDEYGSRDEAFAAARERGDKTFGYDTDGDGTIGANEQYHTRLDTETEDEWNAKFGGGHTPSPGPVPEEAGEEQVSHSGGEAGPKSFAQTEMEPSVEVEPEIAAPDPIIEKDDDDDSPAKKKRGFRFKRKY